MVSAHALQEGGANVFAFDDNPQRVAQAKSENIKTCDLRNCDFSRFDQFVLSPGVPLTHPKPHWSVALAKAAGVEIIGDIELFCRQRKLIAPKSTLIAITGTNGKSTTTALISHVLKNAGRKVEMGGNIGRAVLEFDLLGDDIIYVVEVSSYQIDLSPGLDAQIGILLNISPDHLDRHGSMENYVAVKHALVQQANSAIISIDDEFSVQIAGQLEISSQLITQISVKQQLACGIYIKGRELYFAHMVDNERKVERVADLTNIGSLRGIHNAQNACVAWKACVDCGLSNGEIQAGFDSFPGLVDRMEELGSIGPVLIVNDSKGTNADASDMALGSFERIYWICGGLAKDGGIESLKGHFPKIAKAYLIGEAAPNFAATLGGDVEYEISQTLDKALKHAMADAKSDKHQQPVILMSPACASFDQFSSYVARGEYFRQLVHQADGFISRNN